METITNAVNAVSSTVTSTIWGSTEQKDEKERRIGSEEPTHETFSQDRYPSVMGAVTPPADARYEKPDDVASDFANLSLQKGSSDSKLEMSHDQTGSPFANTSSDEDTITGSSTGNTATLCTLIDAGGGADRDLEGVDPRKEEERQTRHKRHDSGVHGLGHHGGQVHKSYGTEKNDDGSSRNSNSDGTRDSDSKIASHSQGPTDDLEDNITSKTNVDTRREGLPSSNKSSNQGDPSAKDTAVPPTGSGLTAEAGGPTEPSVGADPSSAAQSTQKQQGADRPNETPEDSSKQSESQGTGEEYVKTTGTAADGGDFDACNPGAGKEADRLLEEAGVHRSHPGARGVGPEGPGDEQQGKKSIGERLKHSTVGHHGGDPKSGKPEGERHDDEQHGEHHEEHQGEGEHGKKSLGEKIKDKLHIKKGHH